MKINYSRSRYLYDHGNPYSEILDKNLSPIWERVEKKKASCILMDGGLGEGKTTLAVHVADYFNKRAGLPEISFKEQIGIGGDDFENKIVSCHKKGLPTLIYDESGDFDRRGALTQFNRRLNRLFDIFRAFKIIPILCLPNFSVLDNQLYLKQVLRFLIHVQNRGDTFGDFKGYSLYRMFYLKDKFDKVIVKPMAYNLIQPNFYGHFLDLPPDRAKKLEEYTIAGKLKIAGEKKEEIVSTEGLYTLQEIAGDLGFTYNNVYRKAINRNIKYQIIKGKRYYPKNSLSLFK